MSNGPKIVKPVKEMSRIEELVLQLTNKHAQQRAVGEWQALIEIAKMDGTTVQEAFATVRDIVALRQVLAMEAIAGELHGINQGVMNFVLMTEMAQNPGGDEEVAEEAQEAALAEGEATEPNEDEVVGDASSPDENGEVKSQQVEP